MAVKFIIESDELKAVFLAYLSLLEQDDIPTEGQEFQWLPEFNMILRDIKSRLELAMEFVDEHDDLFDVISQEFNASVDNELMDYIQSQWGDDSQILMYLSRDIELLDPHGSVLISDE